MKAYNTLSGKKEDLKLSKARPTRLFVCGPTVYDSAHIGHARTYLTFDVIARYIRFKGFPLVYLENITDVDDRIIARARERKTDPLKLAAKFEREFKDMMAALNADSVDVFARASEHIPEIAEQIASLVKKGFAYMIPGDGWYFDVSKFPRYGALSRRTAAEAEDSVTRIDESVKKRNKADFCLWKFVEAKKKARIFSRAIVQGEPAWNTPLGWGRPGWHIEDTAITGKFFGPQYEMHGGGVDIKFPHHEAEIAQQEAASGKTPFVKHWLHVGSLLVDGKKMSKSLKNFVTVEDFLGKGAHRRARRANALRLAVLNVHYRSPMNFTEETEEQAEKTLETLYSFLDALHFVSQSGNPPKKATLSPSRVKVQLAQMRAKFISAMDDDFSAGEALAGVFETIRFIQPSVFTMAKKDAEKALAALLELLGVLGIGYEKPQIPAKILKMASERELCRHNKQFIKADALRKKMHGLGYEVSDTPLGAHVRKLIA